MEVRDIEIFLTLAEELHFGRAAARLHLTQARVSQAIGRQERKLGGLLFDRSNRRQIRLTPLGSQLRTDLLPVYANLRDSLERARMAARGKAARLRVGMMPFNVVDLHHFWKTFQTRHPQWELQIRRAPYVDPFTRLREGDMDVFITWLPVDDPDVTVGPVLFHDRRVLAVSAVHELADRADVPVEALADFAHAMPPDMPDYWEDGYLPFYTPRGKTMERVEQVTNADELIHLVITGEIVHPFPSHVTRYWSTLSHVRFVPVPDMGTIPYALVWRRDAENELIRALAQTVRDIGAVRF
ncbi:LysR family transcriptional regulator [Streptomyces sp. TLI_146]|uniref:LysR family transcriptional regulator n=1 Tax=Streptomyces sp. TLI_146 TaxID=1938858 RepID=UPI000C6FD114|nr:LysR family transcriptional regulator [Streptomyces sp. TLI_146]PKV89976.1 DNA-binding transcriptional LysR family regulator [Streptomyces sp. TLI_146]